MKGRAWTKEEDARLRALHRLGTTALLTEFPGRSRSAIAGRANRLRLKIPRTYPAHVRFRGRSPIPKSAHPFVRRLVAEANQQKIFLYEVADRAGVTRQAISRWRYSVTPHLVSLIACLNAVGLDLAVVRHHEERMREGG